MSINFADRRTALVIAHPAHELRLLGWLQATKPTVYVLTDGRGRRNVPRVRRTAQLTRDLGCRHGDLFGDLTDAAIYAALLRGDHSSLLSVAHRLSEAFIRDQIDTVIVDAHENEFLSHDVLNALVRAAILTASSRRQTEIACYDYSLEYDPRHCPDELKGEAFWLRLSGHDLSEKIQIARSYAEVRAEVDQAINAFGEQAFATECLRPVRDLYKSPIPRDIPTYEVHGEQMVREGHYNEVVRFDQHVMPLFNQLADFSPLREGESIDHLCEAL